MDDDLRIRESLQNLFLAAGHQVRTYEDPEIFLAARKPDMPCCALLDLNLGAVNGLDVQARLGRDTALPVIFLTGFAEVPAAVQAMRAGACHFLTKPVMQDELLLAVNSALQQAGREQQRRRTEAQTRGNYLTLTPRERDVLPYIVRGFLNKQTAYELGTSEITIRIHRGRIMHKMRADSLAHLVRLAAQVGIPQD
ncbi:MAG TPA: response regulator [Acidobacteriaceae bacterium]|nr:response regulator [Acidobacteriaceae bacterium]